MLRGNYTNHIDYPERYEDAIRRNIRMNANKTRAAKWLATEEGRRCNAFLFQLDEFEATYMADGTYFAHPVVKACAGDFYFKMRESVDEWGALTDGQTKAVLALIERGEGRVSERAKAREEARLVDADKSGWIGTVGERRVFELTIRMVIEMSGQYGYSYLHVMHDSDGNVVVYKGTNELGKAKDVVTVKATVKDHDIRDGVRQTKIARPAAVK